MTGERKEGREGRKAERDRREGRKRGKHFAPGHKVWIRPCHI